MFKNKGAVSGGAIIGIISLLVVAGVFYFIIKNNPNKGPVAEVVGWKKGNPEASVKIVEYSDFQCPACANMYPIVKELNEKYGDKISFEYRYFPLKQIHPNALVSSEAAEAAGLQGKFWEMHDLLFETQKDWSPMLKGEFKNLMPTYAEKIGLDVEKFKTDIDSDAVKQKVGDSYDFAVQSDINSTPTFILNGVKIESNPRNVEEFSKLIDEALKNMSR